MRVSSARLYLPGAGSAADHESVSAKNDAPVRRTISTASCRAAAELVASRFSATPSAGGGGAGRAGPAIAEQQERGEQVRHDRIMAEPERA